MVYKLKQFGMKHLMNAGQTKVNYLSKMRKNGEKLNEKPRIELSTIHAAKGGEATNVVLLTDLTENTMKVMKKIQTMKIDCFMLVQQEQKKIYI